MYPIIEVPVDAADLFEQLGTKEKFWYVDVHLGRSLFKRGRPNTGENWAEKLACELASALGVPHAFYELASCGGLAGIVSPTFVPKDGRLVHGNELLAKTRPYQEYEDVKPYRSRAHTIRLVSAFLKLGTEENLVLPPPDFVSFTGVSTASDVFAGYLMLDAWIGNQDRHDQNWGLLIDPAKKNKLYLAPSFDHGSSFARNLTDSACRDMLTTKDMGRHISRFVEKARSGFYPHGSDGKTKSLLTLDAFAYMLREMPRACVAWLSRLRKIDEIQLKEIVHMLPDDIVSHVRRDFLVAFLLLNQKRLLALDPGAP